MIPLAIEELEALELGELQGAGEITGLQIDSRRVGPGDLFVAIRGGREFVGEARARGAVDARAERRVRRDGGARAGAARPQPRPVRRRHRLDREDVDEGHPRGALRRGRADGLDRGELQRRARRAADARPARAGDGDLHRRDGHARLRPDRRPLRDRPAARRRHQRRRPRPPRARRARSTASHARRRSSSRRCPPTGSRSSRSRPSWSRICGPTSRSSACRRSTSSCARTVPTSPSASGGSASRSRSRHQAQNALTALTAYEAMDLPLDRLEEGAAAVQLSKWRGEELALPGGGFVVNDAYNANPTSMEAALRHLAERGAGRRRLAILGGMAELGDHAERHHREIAELAGELGIELLAVGELARAYGADDLGAGRGGGAGGRARARPAGRRRPRQGVALGRPRRHRPDPGERHRVMVRVFIAGLIAMVVSVVIGPKFIEFLRRNELGQPIREEGPAGHVVKQGTPVMGGLLIILCATLPFLALSKFTLPALTVLFLTVSCARDRVSRRLHQGPPPPLARAPGPVEAPAARRDHRRRRLRRQRAVAPRHVDLHSGRGRRHSARVVLLPLSLPRDRRRRQRREPDRRPRRSRGRHGDHRAADVPLDQRDRLHPLRRRRRARRLPARPRDPGRGADRGRDRVPLVQRLPRRAVHGRHRLDGLRRRPRRLRDRHRHGGAARS